jgi:hypothetical protein
VEDTVHVLQDITIPKSQNNEPRLTQPSIALCIIDPLIRMLAAVDLDDQPSFEANKICNVIS